MTITLTRPTKPVIAKKIRHIVNVRFDEVVALCPKCKTLETLWFTEDGLMETRKFIQEGTKIYHDCGSDEPCRLFRAF
jgi:hypothetical protein